MRRLLFVLMFSGCAGVAPRGVEPLPNTPVELVQPSALSTRADSAAFLKFALGHMLDSQRVADSSVVFHLLVPDVLLADSAWLYQLMAHKRVTGLCGALIAQCNLSFALGSRLVERPDIVGQRTVHVEFGLYGTGRSRRTILPRDDGDRIIRQWEIGILGDQPVLLSGHGATQIFSMPTLTVFWSAKHPAWRVLEWKPFRPSRGGA